MIKERGVKRRKKEEGRMERGEWRGEKCYAA